MHLIYMLTDWADARHPVPRLWIRSAEIRGTSLGDWEHNNNMLTVFNLSEADWNIRHAF